MAHITLIGGGGVRTPLLIHGLAQAQTSLGITSLSLYDTDAARLGLMAALGREIVREERADFPIREHTRLEDAVEGAAYVLSSIRVGGIAARARDEQLAIAHGFAGQETTGPGGWAMALRTLPVALAHAQVVARVAPQAQLISFTNPAGLVTQAISTHAGVRAIGICDTPTELFHQIALALDEPVDQVACNYFGLNHLGWVRRVLVRGADVTPRLLEDDAALRSLYPGPLFAPELIRSLGLIPTEYLFFYYRQQHAYQNQMRLGASRGQEIVRLNEQLFGRLFALANARQFAEALLVYKDYLRQRSGSYMKLEAQGQSGLTLQVPQDDPFTVATGYHRIALDVMHALHRGDAQPQVINVPNGTTLPELLLEDVVELPCRFTPAGATPLPQEPLPAAVRGLVEAVKVYERVTIQAAVERSRDLARLALLLNPIVGQWDQASALTEAFLGADPEHLGYLQ